MQHCEVQVQIFRYFMMKELTASTENAFLIEINGRELRFTIREFAIVTDLKSRNTITDPNPNTNIVRKRIATLALKPIVVATQEISDDNFDDFNSTPPLMAKGVIALEFSSQKEHKQLSVGNHVPIDENFDIVPSDADLSSVSVGVVATTNKNYDDIAQGETSRPEPDISLFDEIWFDIKKQYEDHYKKGKAALSVFMECGIKKINDKYWFYLMAMDGQSWHAANSEIDMLASLLMLYLKMTDFYRDKQGIDWAHHPSYKEKAMNRKVVKYVAALPQQRLGNMNNGMYVVVFAKYLSLRNSISDGCEFIDELLRTRYGALLWDYAKQKSKS
ncbi:hypothetical protein RND71_010899 [Anisodus tanguticus]|uniref:Uncharacterized protein n=1 Tax=Anisodus tanguticus TaxID=243964 RepID=A0AAE1VSI6_9SOLA|nr:hypothetical protein RND71_010899 [Anisodus tanguticus]